MLMWFIIFSCLVEVTVQIEFGSFDLLRWCDGFEQFAHRVLWANWSIWLWLLLMIGKMFQLGGIVGGVVLALAEFFPTLSPQGDFLQFCLVSYLVAMSVSLLVFRGYYQLIEKASLIMIGTFTLFTVASLVALQNTGFAITLNDFVSGLVPFTTQSCFDCHWRVWNYWCRWRRNHGMQLLAAGKGYRRMRDHGTILWNGNRGKWIRIMYLDAILAMVAYIDDCHVYLQRCDPERTRHRARKYVDQRFGNDATGLSGLGRGRCSSWTPVVLYSTLFAALAAWTRMFADAFSRIGLFNFGNELSRSIWIAVLA